jgi:hypothetical protein
MSKQKNKNSLYKKGSRSRPLLNKKREHGKNEIGAGKIYKNLSKNKRK